MILDGHIHIEYNGEESDVPLAESLRIAGISGGIVISLSPDCFARRSYHYTCKKRLENLLSWADGNQNLYPFYWINPIDSDAGEQVELAEQMGVKGYKVICDSYCPGDARAMKIYEKIANAGKPILFHSGILWDGYPSSMYNRPADLEALLDINGLRFSLAHISWPWVDENIAVYGKYLNARARRPGLSAEMFIDITPGTPPIYRREALTKLFKTGYDVENNVIFGSDCYAHEYNHEYVQEWIKRDNDIYDELGVGAGVRSKIYAENLLRFVGIPGNSEERSHSQKRK